MENDKKSTIVSLNQSGMTLTDIARQIGTSPSYVKKILNKNGLKSNIKPKFGTFEIECSVCKGKFIPKSRSGVTCSLECKKSLLSQKTTAKAIANGAKNVITPEKMSTIVSLRSSGLSISEIALKTNLSKKSVKQWVRRNTDMSFLQGNDKYLKRMDEAQKELAISLSRQGVYVKDIAKQLKFSVTSVKEFLLKHNEDTNVPDSLTVFGKRMDENTTSQIKDLHFSGKNATDISKDVDFSSTSVRNLLNKNGIKPNIIKVDMSRPCVVCNSSFIPKYGDGKDKEKYKTCSKECLVKLISQNNTKYDQDDIDGVISLVKGGYSNDTIVQETGVKLSKVKEIISDNDLYRDEFVGSSAAENEVKMYIESLNLKTEKFKFPTLDGGKEIDILATLDDGTKLGIEYCGLWWHSEASKHEKARNMHINKLKKATLFGISLITIFEDEWVSRQVQVKSFLKSKLKKNETNLFARNLEIKTVEKEKASEFLDSYHIQGSAAIEISYGLYNDEDLVAVMTGCKHHRQNESDVFVLNRLAFKTGISVVGGSSRLFKKLAE